MRVRHSIGVAYGTDVEKVKRVLLQIAAENPAVLKEPAPAAYFVEFGESSLNLVFAFWVDDYHDRFQVLDSINMAISRRFAEEKIEIPFPQRDLHIRSTVVPALGASENENEERNASA